MPARIALGLVGAGRMGTTHAHLLARAVPEVRLVAIADVDVVRARVLAEELDVPAVFDDHRDLVGAPGVDAVLVAASTGRHLEVIRDAAAAGRDILCEKPLALTIAETDAAAAAAERAGVRLQVGFMRRWDADYRRARARVAAGEIGRPFLFKSLQFDAELPPLAFCDPAVSGGILVDMGIHEFDLARWLTGDEVVEVHAYGGVLAHPELAPLGDVETAVVNLRFTGGALGSVELTRSAAYAEDVRTEVVGELGSAFVGLLPLTAGALAVPGRIAVDATPLDVSRFAAALVAQARAFARAILDDRPVEVGGAESRAALAIGLAAHRSMHEGRPVAVTEVTGADETEASAG